jgi:hypothetical protein
MRLFKRACDHTLHGSGSRFPTTARQEWHSGAFEDEPGGPHTMHYIHFTCMICGNTTGDKPYGDTQSPYPATVSVVRATR